MTTSLYSFSVGSYLQVLPALSRIMSKAETYYLDNDLNPDDILGLKLCDDMLPFKFQVLSVINQSVGTIESFKSGISTPPDKSERMSFKELHVKLNEAIEELNALDNSVIDSHAGGAITFVFGETKIPFTTENFVMSFSLPNLYFHATTAYNLLRREGVKLGKRDFLGQLRMNIPG